MRSNFLLLFLSLSFIGSISAQEPLSLFNGEDFTGWKGKTEFWRIENGTIVGETTKDKPTKGNTFLVWQEGEVEDFEFSCEVRFRGNNSGVQYRSEVVGEEADFVLRGYQADLHPKQEYFGMLYGEKFGKRGIIAKRGQKVNAKGEKDVEVLGSVGDGAELKGEEWNTLRIVAVGNRIIHLVNGVVTVDITENYPDAISKGKLGLQLHAGSPMKVEFRNLELRHLSGDDAKNTVEFAAKRHGGDEVSDLIEVKKTDPFWYKKVSKKPEWIWPDGDTAKKAYFRKTFEVPEGAGIFKFYAVCDNSFQLTLDGQLPIASSNAWQFPSEGEFFVGPGKHTLAVEGTNEGSVAGFLFLAEYEVKGEKKYVVSDKSWRVSTEPVIGWKAKDFDDSGWNQKLKILGKLGVGPWGYPEGNIAKRSEKRSTDPMEAENITTLPGFIVEHIYSVPKSEQGSWVSLTVDPGGRFYASDQGKAGLFSIEVIEGEEGPTAEVNRVKVMSPGSDNPLSGAQGLQYAFGSLYFHRNGGNLYQLTDSNEDGEFDTAEVIPSTTGGGEHGNHDVILSEDGKSLYMVGGNHSPLGAFTRSTVTTWDEDLLLPRMWDARGHARGRLAPGGWVTKLDPQSKTQEVISVGYRNQYGAALNKHGDLFTYDADMEWDMGNLWYRPTRICQVVSGSDYGWRSGTGKWPTYFEDTIPPVIEIGPGSPTGVISGKGASFPQRYQEAIYALDWTFGTMYAIHLNEDGAGYKGSAEAFLYGSPLPLTDAVIGKDGNLYFLIGGRGTRSGMFRVRHDGETQSAPPVAANPAAAEARAVRRSLEKFHGVEDITAVEASWEYLSSEDRILRNAARVAIESQPISGWAEKVLVSENPQVVITGSVALARSGGKEYQERLVSKLLALNLESLSEQQLLGMLRAYSLTFIRLGAPTPIQKAKVIAAIDPLLPSQSQDLNHELLKMLIYLKASTAIGKGIELIENRTKPQAPDWSDLASRNGRYGGSVIKMLENHPPSREISYALMLSNLEKGWELEQRRSFFTFLNEASKSSGGASFPGFLENIRKQALASCSDEERKALSDITGENFNPVPDFAINPPKGPGKVWNLDEATSVGSRRSADFENGRSLYFSIGCGACHRLGGLGGGVGPDLTTIPTKFDTRYVMEAIIDPSKDISDQYGANVVTLKDGKSYTGIAIEKGDKLEIYPSDAKSEPIVVDRSKIKSVEESPVSQMPPGMINSLNEQELRDLSAYLMSGGNRNDKRFKK